MFVVEGAKLYGKHKEISFIDSLVHFPSIFALLPVSQNVRYSFKDNMARGVQSWRWMMLAFFRRLSCLQITDFRIWKLASPSERSDQALSSILAICVC